MKFGNCKICGAPPNQAQIEQLEALPPTEKEAIRWFELGNFAMQTNLKKQPSASASLAV